VAAVDLRDLSHAVGLHAYPRSDGGTIAPVGTLQPELNPMIILANKILEEAHVSVLRGVAMVAAGAAISGVTDHQVEVSVAFEVGLAHSVAALGVDPIEQRNPLESPIFFLVP